MRRQGKLHQNAVQGRVAVHLVNAGEKLLLRGVLGQMQHDRVHAKALAHAGLVSHIDLACRIVAHADDAKPRCDAARLESSHAGFELFPQRGGKFFSVE